MSFEIEAKTVRDALNRYQKLVGDTTPFDDTFLYVFTDEELAKLLTAISNRLNTVYPVPGNNDLYHKVDSRGQYGAFRFRLTQLIDAGMIEGNIIAWASNNLSKSGDGPYDSKRRSSWADEAIKKYGETGEKIIDFSPPRTETRNNTLYYLLTNPIPHEISRNKILSDSLRDQSEFADALFSGSGEASLSDEQFQIVIAFLYLQLSYRNLLTARAITYDTQLPVVGGLLAVCLCELYDWGISYSNNLIKANTDGVSSRTWYEAGWNALSEIPKQELEEVSPVPDPITAAITNVKSTATSETPTPGAASVPLSTTTDSGAPNATSERSDSLPPLPTLDQLTAIAKKPLDQANEAVSSNDAYRIVYGVSGAPGEKGMFTARVVDNITGTELASANSSNRTALKTKLLKSLTSISRDNERVMNTGISNPITANPLVIDNGKLTTKIEWLGETGYVSLSWEGVPVYSQRYSLSETFETQSFVNSIERASNKVFSPQDQTAILDVARSISPSTLERVRKTAELNTTTTNAQRTVQTISAIQNDISNSFNTITKSLESWRNTPESLPEPEEFTGPNGESIFRSVEIFDDGSIVTTIEEEDADGNIIRTVEVEPAPPPLIEEELPPLEEEDAVPHPETDVTIVEGPNSEVSYRADNRPQTDDGADTGFQDPNKVYPTPMQRNKPDTNPLALGVNSTHISSNPNSLAGSNPELSRGASPAARSASRKRDVQMAGRNGETWSQPESPYAARYPYNKVFGGESGHVLEIDDTPGAERLNFAHRSGTYDEVGPDGTKVTRVVGNGYTIYDRDGFIYIEGQANVHLAGACNVFIAGDTNLTMHGKASIDVHNDLDLNVGGHIAVSAGKGIFVRNQGIFSLDNVGDVEMRSKGNMTQEVVGTYNVTTTAGYNMTSKADSHVKILGVTYTTSKGDMNFCTEGTYKAKSSGDMNLKTGANMNQETGADFNINSGGTINEESAGDINLSSPKVVSSPIDTSLINVETANIGTLNAGSTNLRATGTDTGTNGGSTHDLPISGPTSPTVSQPAAAASAVDADCAQSAPLSSPVPLELPVTVSRGAGRNRSLADGSGSTGSGSSTETVAMANDGIPAEERNADCEQSQNSSSNSPVDGDGSNSDPVGPASLTAPPSGPYNVSPSGRTYTIPAGISSGRIPMDLKLSDNYTVFHLTRSDYWKGFKAVNGVAGVEDILRNMQAVANLVLEPLRRQYPGFTITSGARTIGYAPGNGASLSAHHIGAAVDLQWSRRGNQPAIAAWIANNIRCDQVLYEDRRWIHVGLYRPNRSREQRGQWADTNANGNFLKTHRARYT